MLFRHEVVSNRKLNDKFNLIKFKSKSSGFSFKVGQFTTMKISDSVFRCYSFASVSEELPFWDIFVDITPGGPGSKYLETLKPGEIIETLGSSGQFTLKNGLKSYVFGATGCGIAPFLPMIEYLSKKEAISIYVYWGLRAEDEIALIDLLESHSKTNNNFHYDIVLSGPNKKWDGKKGHITEEILTRIEGGPFKNTGVYLSGSGEFITDARELLIKRKFPSDKIYHEACY